MPPNAKDYTSLRSYTRSIVENHKTFPCPQCKTILLPKQFEKHCSQNHQVNSRLSCVWCLGKVSWKSGQKNRHVDHLLPCFRKFIKLVKVIQPQPQPPENVTPSVKPRPKAFDMKPMAEKRCLFGHVFEFPPARALDLVWPMPLDPNPLTFEDESLDRAASCVRKYLELGDRAEWFHVMVRIPAFPGFLEAMDGDEGRTRTLTFSCWCDGGQPPEARFRQHRHMIVVSSPPGHFLRNVWAKIEIGEQRPRRNFRCMYYKRLTSAMHLANTIGYLCKRESQCNFTGEDKKSPEKRNHFYLFESLPRDYMLPLVLQWEGGLVKLFDQNFRSFDREELVKSILTFFERKWRFKIKNIPGITLDTVLPVAKDFQPCRRRRGPTDFFLHLTGKRKLYFERDPNLKNLTREAWLQKQADMGNLFYFVVGEDHWTPRPYHQGLINDFKPIVDRNRELESKMAALKEEILLMKQKHADSEREIEALSVKVDESNSKCSDLKIKNSQLKEKCSKLSDKNCELNEKIHQLNEKIHQLHEGEIARLKRENESLKRENESLKRENESLKRENVSLKRKNEILKTKEFKKLGKTKRSRFSI